MSLKPCSQTLILNPVLNTSIFQSESDQNSRVVKISLDALKKKTEFSGNKTRDFTILFTGDTHSNLEPSVASFVSEKPLGGVVRRIHYLEKFREESRTPVILLEAGDILQGTPYFETYEGHPDVEFMNMAGYNVMTVGNHDFDNGWQHLEGLLKKGNFDSICANIFRQGEMEPCLPPYTLLDIDGCKVAIVGLMGVSSWKSIRPSLCMGLEMKDPWETMDVLLPTIRPYVDLVILLSHSGIQEDRVFARHPMVDIIIGGHSHTLMTKHELVDNTPIFHGFRNGQLIGRMDVSFDETHIPRFDSSIQYLDEEFDTIDGRRVNEKAIARMKFLKQEMDRYNVVLGECIESLPTENKGLSVVPIGEAITSIFRMAGEADIGIIPSGAIKVGIEKGPFNLGVVHRVLAHKEALWVVTIKGSLLLDLMLRGQERWGKQRTFQYSGITFSSENEKISKATVGDRNLDVTADYKVAGPSFFFEREFMDKEKRLLPEFREEIKSIKEVFEDLREPFASIVTLHGIGRWVKGVQQKEVINF